MVAVAGQILSVFKLRIGVVIMLSALAGLAVTPGPMPEAYQVWVLAVAVLISAASAGAFNQYIERDIDGRMSRTANRPFVTGRFTAGPVWPLVIWGLMALAVGAAAYAVNAWAALYTFLGAFTYAVVYTVWLKRRTWLNIVFGGLAGSFAVLAGAAAVDPGIGASAFLFSLALFLWTPPHFWSLALALKDDYAAAGVPMLPVVVGSKATARIILASTLALVFVSLTPAFVGMGTTYLVGALLGGAIFIWFSVKLVGNPTKRNAMLAFFSSLIQLTILLAAAMADRWLIS
jgi:protoheme IX farnesyltransferase